MLGGGGIDTDCSAHSGSDGGGGHESDGGGAGDHMCSDDDGTYVIEGVLHDRVPFDRSSFSKIPWTNGGANGDGHSVTQAFRGVARCDGIAGLQASGDDQPQAGREAKGA